MTEDTVYRLPKSEHGQLYMSENEVFLQYKKRGAKIIPDGALSERAFRSARLRVLVILKEPNDETGGWQAAGNDLRGFGWCGGRRETWTNLARWSCLAEDPSLSFTAADEATSDSQGRAEQLRRIVVMNLKKVPGGSTSKISVIRKSAEEYEDLLKRQICLYGPDITLTGGTFGIISSLFGQKRSTWLAATRSRFHSFHHEMLGRVIDFYHPQARKLHRELYELLARDLKYHKFS